MTIFVFALKRSLRNVYNLGLLLVAPLLVMFWPPNEGSPLPVGYRYFGIVQLFAAAKLVHIILEDRMSRVVVRIGAAPVTHFRYLLQNLLAYALLLIAQAAVAVAGGILAHGEVFPAPFALFLLFACFAMTAIGFSLAWCSLFRNKEASLSVMSGVIMLLCLVGGLFWPVEIMPPFMRRAAMILPTYWLAEGITLASFEAAWTKLIVPVGMLLMFTLLFVLTGSKRRMA
ncbi:ABC transporter permease [Cohnella massiliensis]|uniref:ABC transporter permease n=1 Tax=Cohnella massiliensis TaxID=1816691 RepID=UPI0009BA9B9C|nr:ABC transporter permease [Cohnella massiliensis]